MPGKTRVCSKCKESFLMENMVQYASPKAKNLNWYCQNCYKERLQRDTFSDSVCKIFGIKSPGPRIWTERKRLIDTYGYTDQTIVDCLDYLYNVKKLKKLAESLCLVTPTTIHEMLAYQRQKAFEATYLAIAMQEEQKEYVIPVPKRKKKIKKVEYDPDEWLDD